MDVSWQINDKINKLHKTTLRIVYSGGSRTAATSKMERFVIIVNGWKPLTIITKRSILDVAAVLDPPLVYNDKFTIMIMIQNIQPLVIEIFYQEEVLAIFFVRNNFNYNPRSESELLLQNVNTLFEG